MTTLRGDLDGYGYQWWTSSIRGHAGPRRTSRSATAASSSKSSPTSDLVVVGSTAVVDGETPFDPALLIGLVRDVIVPEVE